MPAFKNLRVTDEQRRQAEREWEEFFRCGDPFSLDPSLDPTACILLGHGPSHYRVDKRGESGILEPQEGV